MDPNTAKQMNSAGTPLFKTPNGPLNTDDPQRVLTIESAAQPNDTETSKTPVQRPTMRLRLCDVMVFLKK